jgi:uncharacterized protein (DUF486 family)
MHMNDLLQSRWLPVLLLTGSNVFMTFAWYGHLKFKEQPLWLVILASWGIAFFEYCLMVPANRWGSGRYTATELKIIQEVVTLTVFSGFAMTYLGERIRWNHVAAFGCIIGAVAFTFLPRPDAGGAAGRLAAEAKDGGQAVDSASGSGQR